MTSANPLLPFQLLLKHCRQVLRVLVACSSFQKASCSHSSWQASPVLVKRCFIPAEEYLNASTFPTVYATVPGPRSSRKTMRD
ncbi:hypothetical protein TREES_T100016652 [Tupaia chinensis]|uniref:Uncharacterized protein n=1 Tax=Tupaia chinensis TaxID=246437 RepID=L9L6S6_TUPCH|nr:hypothetical protein TREES_T100016652 [Tupaia chinensis]